MTLIFVDNMGQPTNKPLTKRYTLNLLTKAPLMTVGLNTFNGALSIGTAHK